MAQVLQLLLWGVLPVPFAYWALALAWRKIGPAGREHWRSPPGDSTLPSAPSSLSAFGLPMFCGAALALAGAVPERYFVQLQGSIFAFIWPQSGPSSALMAWGRTLWLALLGVALWEELLKYFALRYFYKRHWAEPGNWLSDRMALQLVLLGALALAFGFAAAENLWYMLRSGSALPWRLLSSSLVHLCLAALLGLRLQQRKRFFWLWAILWHGGYDAALAQGSGILATAILLALLLSTGWQLWRGFGVFAGKS